MPAPASQPLPPGRPLTACSAVLWLLFLVAIGARADEFDTLRTYWLNQLVGTNNSASTLTSRAVNASNYWGTLNTNASRTYLWSDLPFGSVSANVSSSFNRLKTMSLAWASPGCSLYGDTNLGAAITNGLDWMAANVYKTNATEYNNWWDWEIGSPQAFNDTQVMMYPALTAAQVTNYNNSVDHCSPPTTSWMTGANLTDKCKVVLIRGIVGKNSGKMAYGQTNMSPVFPYVTSSDGFYHDGSFIQHTKFAYTGTYGNVLLGDVAQLVNLLDGSTWKITDPKLTNVFNWVTDSYQPVVYNGAMMDMLRGRAISRYSETEQNDGSSAISSIRKIALFAPPATAQAFTNWANSPSMPPGQYHFAAMDRVVAWRSNFCFGVSMCSTRVANYESINGENLHGWFTGDGMTYLYLGNPEAQFTGDFWPTVDPYHLPGTTVEQTNRADAANQGTLSSQNWVGGAQVADRYGVAGMSLAAASSTLTGKKSWFMFDNEVVCLGAAVTAGGTNEIHTTVEDRRLGASPTNHFFINGADVPPVLGWSSNLTGAAWCSLAGVGGYYFPGGATNLQAKLEQRANAWVEINNGTYLSTTTNLNTNSYLKLWFNHGAKPTNSTYAYVLLPNFSAAGMSNYAAAPDIVLVTNTPLVQAVSKPSLGAVAANFWTNNTATADLITANKKSSVITLETPAGLSVGVADPTQTNTGAITVTLNRAAAATVSADPGVTVVQLSPQIVLSVNVSGSLGKTYQASFLYPPPTFDWDADTGATGAQDGAGGWESPNWWTGSADVSWSDATPAIAAFGSGGAAGTVALAGPHNAFSLVFNAVGSGAYTLAGPGTLALSNGITANATAAINAPLSLPSSQIWSVATNQVLTVNGTLSAPSPVTLSLAGPGTVNLGGTNQISTNIAAISFTDTLNRSTLGIASATQTIATVNLNDGVTAAVSGNGTLVVNGAVDLTVGGTAAGAAQTLDFSGLQNFVFNNANAALRVSGQVQGASGSAAAGTLSLGRSNFITAASLGVGDKSRSVSASSWNTGALRLGQWNSVWADAIQIGGNQVYGTVSFNAGLPANPVLILRGSDGLSRTTVAVGTGQSSNYEPTQGTLDLISGVNGTCQLDALVGTLTLGQVNYGNGTPAFGTMTLGGGTLDATNIMIARRFNLNSGTGAVTGSLTNIGALIKVQTLTLGSCETNASSAVTATLALQGGAVLRAQTVQPGASLGTGTIKRNFIWDDGTIANYDAASDLAIAGGLTLAMTNTGAHIFNIDTSRSGVIDAVLSGSGSLVKSGAGTLLLTTTNTYSGSTTVSSGTLLVLGATGTNTLTVAAGATLGGTGTVNGPATLQSGGTIQNSAGNFNLAALNLGGSSAATTYSAFTIASGGRISATNLAVAGTNIVNILDPGLAAGTNTLFIFTGAISGGGSFKLGAVPPNVSARLQTNGTALQLVTTPLAPPAFAGSPAFTAGKFVFSFSGTNGQSYRVLASTNLLLPLTNWPVLTGGNFAGSLVSYTDNVTTNVQRFYRIVSP